MEQIYKTDLKTQKNFRKFGEDFSKIWSDDEHHIYVFKRVKVYNLDDGKTKEVISYEVIKGVKAKNPDGTIVYAYPSSEQFGKNGYYISGNEKYCKERISKRISDFLIN